MGSSTLVSGLILGTISVATLLVSYMKLPQLLKNLLLKVKWLTDLSAGAVVYVLLGQTVTAIIASAWATMWVGILLTFAGKKE